MAARTSEPKVKEDEQGQHPREPYAKAQIMSLLSGVPNSAQRDSYYQAEHD
jgi:hypothetical protein